MAKGNFRYLVLSYLRLEGISDFEGNRPGNHQNSLKSRTGNNNGIKYHRWLYILTSLFSNTGAFSAILRVALLRRLTVHGFIIIV